MRVEIVHISECPNWRDAGRLVAEAASALGATDIEIAYRLLETPADASTVPFSGSPTIVIDGVDAFPAGATVTELACRVFTTPNGLAGLPTREQVVEVVKQRLAPNSRA